MMNEFHSLLDEGYFVQLRREEGRQEGLQEGLEEGLVEGLQEAVEAIVEVRFPTLLDLVQVRTRQARTPEKLRLALKGIKVVPNEEAARVLLDLLAA